MSKRNGIYEGRDPRDLPIYPLAEAARYLRLSPATLRSWVAGRTYPRTSDHGYSEPLVVRPEQTDSRLSFHNLVEAHVLRALRVAHRVPMPEIRTALSYAEEHFGIDRLLIRKDLKAAPGSLFLDKYGQLINLGRAGQLAMKRLLEAHLRGIEHDFQGLPCRFYPLPAEHSLASPKLIVINPRISFGRPVLAGSSVSTATIADRIDAGESIEEVARDYGLANDEVEEAIVYERAA